jgi:hypothetical protein
MVGDVEPVRADAPIACARQLLEVAGGLELAATGENAPAAGDLNNSSRPPAAY